MEIKVDRTGQVQQTQPAKDVQQSDGTFKFTLASRIEESELQTRIQSLMEEITMQGDRLYKKRDIRDMKRYRGLIKDFLNEVVYRSILFPERIFWINGDGTEYTVLSG